MSEPDLVVRGGLVVNPDWSGEADVVVKGGRVVSIMAAGEAPGAATTIDAAGRWVLPGGVDPHVHIGIEFGGFGTGDDYEACTRAALHGGTTTLVDFAIPRVGQTPLAAATERREMTSGALTDVALHGCVVSWDADTARQLREMADLGILTIKMFTTYRGIVMAELDTIRRVLEALREIGGLAYVHAESNHLIERAQEHLATAGQLHVRFHPASRPALAEHDAVSAVLAIAESTDAPVYFVHQTTPDAVDLVERARARGVRAYSETCPHYILFDEAVYAKAGGEGYVCCPPVRDRGTVDALMDRTLRGAVDTLGSDHCGFSLQQKTSSRHDVRHMPYGLPGVETRLPVLFSELVQRRGLAPERFVELTATNPARLNGLYPRKGVIAPGADADITVWQPDARWTVKAADLHMPTDYSPYEGHEITGRPEVVISGGQVVVQRGQEVSRRKGRLLRSTPI